VSGAIEMTSEREQELLAIIEAKDQRIKLLEQKVDLLVRRIFGSSSEKLDPGQMELKLEELLGKTDPSASINAKIAEGEESKAYRRCQELKERRPRLPEHLPFEEERIEPLEVVADPTAWKQIGQEVTEQLDYRPAVYLRRRIVRPKYVSLKNRDRAPIIAPLPPMLQERCLATPGLLAHVVVSKYADHLPLYRQEQILQQRYRIPISRQTLDGWVMLVADWMRPIYERIKTAVMEDGYIQVDETPIRFLEPGNGKARQGYLWTASRPGRSTIYHWHPGRGIDGLESVLPADYKGVIQCDGYAVYGAHARSKPIELAGCWAHVRRKFFEAQEQDWRMGWILKQIGHLYYIERDLRRIQAGAALREATRAWQARPIVKRISKMLERWKACRRFLPKSAGGMAVEYTLNLWTQLEVYLSDGRIEIDNNHVENAIRPTAIGKKNWLFIGAENAGTASAVLYTIIQECRRLGLNPQTYLTQVLQRLPTTTTRTVATLTPEALAPIVASSLKAA
jgi:transposase